VQPGVCKQFSRSSHCATKSPPTLNLEDPDPAAAGIDLIAGQPRPMAMKYAISNWFGFGGMNASLILRR
jgi:3-oxoacyl-[acyl-carrier-protein] synthase II